MADPIGIARKYAATLTQDQALTLLVSLHRLLWKDMSLVVGKVLTSRYTSGDLPPALLQTARASLIGPNPQETRINLMDFTEALLQALKLPSVANALVLLMSDALEDAEDLTQKWGRVLS